MSSKEPYKDIEPDFSYMAKSFGPARAYDEFEKDLKKIKEDPYFKDDKESQAIFENYQRAVQSFKKGLDNFGATAIPGLMKKWNQALDEAREFGSEKFKAHLRPGKEARDFRDNILKKDPLYDDLKQARKKIRKLKGKLKIKPTDKEAALQLKNAEQALTALKLKPEYKQYAELLERQEKLDAETDKAYLTCQADEQCKVEMENYIAKLPDPLRGAHYLDNGRETIVGGFAKWAPIIQTEADAAFARLYLKYLEAFEKHQANLDVYYGQDFFGIRLARAGINTLIEKKFPSSREKWKKLTKKRLKAYEQNKAAQFQKPAPLQSSVEVKVQADARQESAQTAGGTQGSGTITPVAENVTERMELTATRAAPPIPPKPARYRKPKPPAAAILKLQQQLQTLAKSKESEKLEIAQETRARYRKESYRSPKEKLEELEKKLEKMIENYQKNRMESAGEELQVQAQVQLQDRKHAAEGLKQAAVDEQVKPSAELEAPQSRGIFASFLAGVKSLPTLFSSDNKQSEKKKRIEQDLALSEADANLREVQRLKHKVSEFQAIVESISDKTNNQKRNPTAADLENLFKASQDANNALVALLGGAEQELYLQLDEALLNRYFEGIMIILDHYGSLPPTLYSAEEAKKSIIALEFLITFLKDEGNKSVLNSLPKGSLDRLENSYEALKKRGEELDLKEKFEEAYQPLAAFLKKNNSIQKGQGFNESFKTTAAASGFLERKLLGMRLKARKPELAFLLK